MIIGNAATDAYPFMAKSTMRITRSGLSLAPERVLGAKLYPKVKEPTLIHISKLDKTRDYVKLDLASTSEEYIASVYFPLTNNCPYVKPQNNDKYSVGYAIQDGELCGCILGDALLLPVLRTVPTVDIDPYSFIFSPTVCFLRITDSEKSGKLLYDGKEVKSVIFDADGKTLTGNSELGYTINTSTLGSPDKLITVKGIRINGEYELGGKYGDKDVEDIYIVSGKDSGIRVISDTNSITIGRFMDL